MPTSPWACASECACLVQRVPEIGPTDRSVAASDARQVARSCDVTVVSLARARGRFRGNRASLGMAPDGFRRMSWGRSGVTLQLVLALTARGFRAAGRELSLVRRRGRARSSLVR